MIYHLKKIWDFLRKLLTNAKLCSMLCRTGLPMTIRETIQKELLRRGWSHYRLAKELEGKMPDRTVYAYLGDECDLVSDRVSIILEALGLTVTGKSKKRKQSS